MTSWAGRARRERAGDAADVRSDPHRRARPSHLVTTAGVGAVMDLPSMSVIVRGLDAWSPERAGVIVEPRLLAEVQRVLGPQVRALRKAPWDPADVDDPWTRTGVPVAPFPRWVRCPRCYRLGPLDPPGQFSLVHRYGRRPDLAKWVHSHCQKQGQSSDFRKRPCLPARFLVACEAGHLDEFPYVDFVHQGRPCPGPKLAMSDSASTLGPRVTVRCTECGASRNVQEAAGTEGWERLPRCRGRHPHLQRFEGCGRPLRLMVLGASNLWFGVTASALHLPRSHGVADIVAANWEVLGAQPSAEVTQLLIDQMAALRDLRGVPVADVWRTVAEMRAQGGPDGEAAPAEDLLDAEWELLAGPCSSTSPTTGWRCPGERAGRRGGVRPGRPAAARRRRPPGRRCRGRATGVGRPARPGLERGGARRVRRPARLLRPERPMAGRRSQGGVRGERAGRTPTEHRGGLDRARVRRRQQPAHGPGHRRPDGRGHP